MKLRRVVPANGGELDVTDADARTTLLTWYEPGRPEHLRLNLVTSLDGRAAGADGTSESLTSRADRMILGVIRELSDLVLVGAESVRREGYLRPRRAALAIVSASGDLSGHRLDDSPSAELEPHPLIVLTTGRGAARAAATLPGSQVLVLDGVVELDLGEVVVTLRQEGYRRIVAEGGPRLAAQLLEQDLVDEVCMTIMPRVGGPALPAFTNADLGVHPVTPLQMAIDDTGAQFGRWGLTRARQP